jgi:hypothetical protein
LRTKDKAAALAAFLVAEYYFCSAVQANRHIVFGEAYRQSLARLL